MAEKKPSSTMAKGKEPMASSDQGPPTKKFKAATENMGLNQYAVELYFDENLHNKILSVPINIFKDHNFTTRLHGCGWTPCLSLYVDKHVDREALSNVIATFASTHQGFRISFFPSTLLVAQDAIDYTLCLALMPSMNLHLYDQDFRRMMKEQCSSYDVKRFWAPLVPLGFRVTDTEMAVKALDSVFQENFDYTGGDVTRIGLADYTNGKRTPLFSLGLWQAPPDASSSSVAGQS